VIGRVIQLLEALHKAFVTDKNAGVELTGSKVEEQKTETDAVANVLTFSANISAIEIYHEDVTRQQFTVNGITLNVPPKVGYRTPVGGTPAATVTIPAGVSCIVGRLT